MAVKLLYFSSTEWGNLGRRKVRLGHELAQLEGVASVLFVNPAVQTSVLDLARGRFMPSHLGDDWRAHADAVWGRPQLSNGKLTVYTGTTKAIPLTRSERLRRSVLLNQFNYDLYFSGLRRQLAQLPGDEVVVWLSHPLHLPALERLPERRLAVYDWTDDWTAYSQLPVADRAELERAGDRMLREADLVLTVSESLRQKAAAVNRGTFFAPNAADFDLLSKAADPAHPAAPEVARLSRPVIGYLGQIGENIDYALIRDCVAQRPGWSFVFVGPVWATRQAEVDELKQYGNVHFLGGKPHRTLPDYFRGFDACWMPHLNNALTRSMDPTKLYDYLASGKPIVSTPVAGTERFAEVVRFGESADELIAELDSALNENGAGAAARLEAARRNSWPLRAREIWEAIEKTLESTQSHEGTRS
jgi:glycosyltransferase involved in cell wall biosynthesis